MTPAVRRLRDVFRHPSSQNPPPTVAQPSDRDLTWDLHGVCLCPAVVVDRELFIRYTAAGGVCRGKKCDGVVDGELIMVVSSICDTDFVEYMGLLDEWSYSLRALRFCAAKDRQSAFYDSSGRFLPIPPIDAP